MFPNWCAAPHWANWVTCDPDGKVKWHETEPVRDLDKNIYSSAGKMMVVTPPDMNCSIMERPEFKYE